MEQAGYYEPSLEILLPLAAFPLLLHIVAWPLNKLISCGLLGQIVVGMIFGAPLTQWLGDETYATVLQLGYIGLILLVYEGKRTPRLQMFSVCCFEKFMGLT
jgi:Kef-type K+ transport system membrane component KefB